MPDNILDFEIDVLCFRCSAEVYGKLRRYEQRCLCAGCSLVVTQAIHRWHAGGREATIKDLADGLEVPYPLIEKRIGRLRRKGQLT